MAWIGDNFGEELKVHVVKRPDMWDGVDIFILRAFSNHKTELATIKDGNLEFSELKEGEMWPRPTMQIPESLLQKIIDAFSKEVPPTKKVELDAELKATKYHLEDMRKLVFEDPKYEIQEISGHRLARNEK